MDTNPTSNPPHPKQEGALLRDALLRMRADEACIHHVSAVLADLRPGDRWVRGGRAGCRVLAD